MHPTLLDRLLAELRALPETRKLSAEFYSAYVAFKNANRELQLAVFARAHGGKVPDHTRRVVERENRPLPQRELLAALLAASRDDRIALAHEMADALTEESDTPPTIIDG